MIRVEVSSEADVTRMVAAFVTLPVLADQDYEIWLAGETLASQPWGAGATRRAWREDGQRGATEPTDWTEPGRQTLPGEAVEALRDGQWGRAEFQGAVPGWHRVQLPGTGPLWIVRFPDGYTLTLAADQVRPAAAGGEHP